VLSVFIDLARTLRGICPQDLLRQIQVVETCGGGIFQDLIELEPPGIVWIIDVLQILSDRSPALVEGIRPGIEQITISGIVTGCTPGGKRLLTLSWCVYIVTVRARDSAIVGIGRPRERRHRPLHGGLLGRVARAALTRQRTIPPGRSLMAFVAAHRGMKRIQTKRGVPVVRE
jgi:hypothetical protein